MSMKQFTAALAAVAGTYGFALFDDGTSWSLGHCQGDGCVFEGLVEWPLLMTHLMEVDTTLAGHLRHFLDAGGPDVAVRRTSHHYCHEHTARADVDEFADALATCIEARGLVTSPHLVNDLVERVTREIEERRLQACREMERLGYAFLDTWTHEERTLHSEAIGEHTMEIRILPNLHDCFDAFPEMDDTRAQIEWLEMLDRAPYGRFVTGDLTLIDIDEDGEETVIETLGLGTYDTTDEAYADEGWSEISALRKELKALANCEVAAADTSPHTTEAPTLSMAA